MLPLKPPVGAKEMVEFPVLPCATLREDGEAERLKPGAVTVTVTVVLAEVVPDVPVTVMVYVPAAVDEGTLTVMAEVCVPEIEAGLILAVGPAGETE